MPDTMIDIFDKSSALGNVFNKAVSSADGVNSVRAGEGVESDGAEKSVPFQEILGQEMTKDASCSACPPQKSGKAAVTPGAAGTQKDALMPPLLTGDKLPSARLQAGKEGIKGVKLQKGEEIHGSVINEQILNGIFSVNMPLQLAAGTPSNPQTIEGESGLQMGDTITGNVANAASTLFTATVGIPVGIGDETGDGFSMVDNQPLLATAGKGATVEGLNLSTSASAAYVKEATVGIAPRQGNAPSVVDNQTLLATAGKGVTVEGLNLSTSASAAYVKEATMEIVAGPGNEPSIVDNQTLLATAGKGIPVEGLNLSAAISAPFVEESATGTNARPGNAPSLLDNQSLQAAAGNEDLYGAPVEEKGVTVKNLGFGMVKDTGNLQMAGKSGLNNIPLLQLLRNGQLPPSLIEIRGRAFQGSNTGAVMNRMPGFYELPIQNTSQGGEQVFSMQTMLNALRMAEAAGVKVAPDAQGNDSVEVAATNALQMTKEPNAVSGFSPERDGVDAATFQVATQATPVSPSLTVHEQPAKGPRSPNHPDLQHNAFVSQGINTIQTSSVDVMSYLRNDKTDATGQTQADVIDQLFQRISLATHGDRSEIKMNLTPPELGFVKEATVGIAHGQGNEPSMVDNQALLATAVKESTIGTNARPGNAPSQLDNQSLQAAAGNEDLSGAPVEAKGVTVKNLGFGMVKDAGRLQMAGKSGPNNIPLLQLLRNGQLPSSLIEIRGRAFQGSNTGAVMSRMPGFYELPIQNTSQGGEQVFSMQTMLNALRMAEAAGVKVAPDAQGNASVEMAATNALHTTKEPNAVSGFFPEQDGVDAAAFKASAQAIPVSPSLTVHEQPAKELLLPNATGLQQGKHVYREDGASANAFGSQQDGGQESFEEQPEEPDILDFASLDTSAPKTPGDLSIMANTQPAKGPRSQNHLDLQHNAFVSHGINTIQTSSAEGSDGVMSYLRNDRTDATGQTQADVMDQLFQRISLATHGDRSEIKMYLTPPELGKVKIHFTEEHDEVKAKIFVENAEVKATIEHNVHHLRESIASSGINIHKLEVYLQNEETGKQKSLEDFNANNFGRQNQGQRQTGEGRYYFGEGKTDDKVVNRESGANASNYIIDYIS